MKLSAYDYYLPSEEAVCDFPVPDPNNQYGGSKKCGKPARVVSKQNPNGKPESLCDYHLGATWGSSHVVKDQLLAELLIRALREESK